MESYIKKIQDEFLCVDTVEVVTEDEYFDVKLKMRPRVCAPYNSRFIVNNGLCMRVCKESILIQPEHLVFVFVMQNGIQSPSVDSAYAYSRTIMDIAKISERMHKMVNKFNRQVKSSRNVCSRV